MNNPVTLKKISQLAFFSSVVLFFIAVYMSCFMPTDIWLDVAHGGGGLLFIRADDPLAAITNTADVITHIFVAATAVGSFIGLVLGAVFSLVGVVRSIWKSKAASEDEKIKRKTSKMQYKTEKAKFQTEEIKLKIETDKWQEIEKANNQRAKRNEKITRKSRR